MDEDRIRQIVREVIEQSRKDAQYSTSRIPFHTHNGVDSHPLSFTDLTDVPGRYVGAAGQVPTVNSTETGMDFASGGGGPFSSDVTFNADVILNGALRQDAADSGSLNITARSALTANNDGGDLILLGGTGAGTGANGNVRTGGDGVATTSNGQFLKIANCAGTPTGTPTSGQASIIYDTTANKIWVYNGSWRSVAVT